MGSSSNKPFVSEQDFGVLLRGRAEGFLTICAVPSATRWSKRRFFEVSASADELESFLDDHGARTNRTFSAFTELVASIRGFALAGMQLAHLDRRLDSYGVAERLAGEGADVLEHMREALSFVQDRTALLMGALLEEGRELCVTELRIGEGQRPEDALEAPPRLANNVDLDRIDDDDHRIAKVATSYLSACEMLENVGIEPMEEPERREEFLRSKCSEEAARVWEATVHNLQSSYDTYVKNTVLETGDPRLPDLRGHASAALHSLGAVTHLTHFVERHERGLRSDMADSVLQRLVPRSQVRDVTLNRLLVSAQAFIRSGAEIASSLLPSYTSVSSLELCLREGIFLHARPASLIVAIVQHHGTPVELEVAGSRCNAGSILELMVAIGSNPEQRNFVAHGDERTLKDLGELFAADLGEGGLDELPNTLNYLRQRKS
ncbi:MAG: HPr family phosphocarrier protein [Planctomycetota bacterium]|nr:HPr family phosphocarrier protein [Planctomycetota bacterium]MDG1984141.1 HPr family phosphocarrier protein [Planctomycetota bacterium]